MMPVYLALSGYSPLLVGACLAATVAGSAFSNLLMVKYKVRVGNHRFLLLFSFLMFLSGLLLFSTSSFLVVVIACFVGNISTTGSEAGPFQSVEVTILPSLVSKERQNRTFGVYNMIGYGASSVGAFAASAPSYFQNSLYVFRSLFLLYALVGILLVLLYMGLQSLKESQSKAESSNPSEISQQAKSDVTKLSALFSVDSFGGGFVSQSLLAYWFYLTYNVSLGDLGIIFFVVNVITALSTLASMFLADRIGNLRTMVSTHLISSVFLVLIPFAGSLTGALSLLFARQSLSQMDVPTRQAFMAGIFNEQERLHAYATTNTSRALSTLPGSPASGALLGVGLVSVPLLIAGFSKIAYDGLIYSMYRKRTR